MTAKTFLFPCRIIANDQIGICHFRVALSSASYSKRVLVQSLSYENEFCLLYVKTRLKRTTEKSILELSYYCHLSKN